MGLLSWIILGLIAGYIAYRLVGERGHGFLMNTAVGVVGAVIGGEIMEPLGRNSVTGLNIYSMAVAVAGAIVLLAVVRLAQR
jgi:uncharacterized membrane protein YeaQ/YmgE (transglycosylase-associated protein family)